MAKPKTAAQIYADNVKETRAHFYGLIDALHDRYMATNMPAETFDAKRAALLVEMQSNLRSEQGVYRINRAAETHTHV